MSFKENLLAKIKIDRLAAKVIASIAPVESGSKVDKDAMRSLLEMSRYEYQKVRDLDLYVEKTDQPTDQRNGQYPQYDQNIKGFRCENQPQGGIG
jgi:hypothetical protein